MGWSAYESSGQGAPVDIVVVGKNARCGNVQRRVFACGIGVIHGTGGSFTGRTVIATVATNELAAPSFAGR
jgi:hypothetical protein